MYLNFGAENADFTHLAINKDGKITGFFRPHDHEDIFIEDLEPVLQASVTNVVGAVVKAVAEKIKAGSTDSITEQNIRDEFQLTVDTRIAKDQAAKEAEK